ncbi:Thiol-disulfide oxidoreductase ResA [compost metagenome]
MQSTKALTEWAFTMLKSNPYIPMRYVNLFCTLILLAGLSIPAKSQFHIRGQIISATEKEDLKLNMPLVFGFYASNSLHIPVAKDGSFALEIPIKEARFANLIYQKKFFQLLLRPGKDLQIMLKKADTSLHLVSGSALTVNEVVQQADIEEYPSFFNKENTYYTPFSVQQLQQQVVIPYFAKCNEKIRRVMQSDISETDKQKISGELTAITYNYLNDLFRTANLNRSVADSLIIQVFDRSDIQIQPSGPQFYAFVDNYVRYLETKAFHRIKAEHIAPSEAIPYFGISLDSANKFVNKYSKAQWRFLGAIQNLPPAIAEKYTYQLIVSSINYKELKQAADLAGAFRQQFPKSTYLPAIANAMKGLESLLVENEHNAAIKIIPEMEKITSVYDMIKSLKGKVIYLDVWGTWCGPCKAELPYVPKLKEKFKDKPVAFVYLDMDEDDKDNDWRNFIKVNAIEGLHLRKSRKDIAAFWKELLADASDKAEYYPQYFIFDPNGKLVITKAARPSSEDILYKQLNTILGKTTLK